MGNHLTHVHLMAFFIAAGYNSLLAASAIGAVGLVGMAGRPVSGALSDRLGREVVYTLGSGMQIGGIGLLREGQTLSGVYTQLKALRSKPVEEMNQ